MTLPLVATDWNKRYRASPIRKARGPTTAIVAPTIVEVADLKVFAARNAPLLRNTSMVNFFDLCAISLPLSASLPVGLMLVARNGHDHRLLRIADAVMRLFAA